MSGDAAKTVNQERKVRGRPFRRGESGNPAGRPVGARNKITMAAQELLDGEGERLTRTAIDLALAGDTQALRLCIERLLPVARERSVDVEMPVLTTVADLPPAVAKLLHHVAAGDLTPSEGEKLAGLLSVWRQSVELVDMERRIAAIESEARR